MTESARSSVELEVSIQRHVGAHENIVNIHKVYEDQDNVYIVMELCEGGDMFDRLIAKGRSNPKKTLVQEQIDMDSPKPPSPFPCLFSVPSLLGPPLSPMFRNSTEA